MELRNELDHAFFSYLARPNRRRLARLIRAAHPVVWATALRATASRQDADDIAQEVFLHLLQRPPASGSVRSASGYLVWAVIGRVTNADRAERRRREREREGARLAREDQLDAEAAEDLRVEVRRLRADLRAVVELRYFGGLGNRQVADVLGVSERLVVKRLRAAREELRRRLERTTPAALALLDPEPRPATPPPEDFADRLLRIARLGAGLGSVRKGTTVGISMGALMTAKKVSILTGAGLLFLAALAAWKQTAERESSEGLVTPGELVDSRPETEPAPATAGVEEAHVSRKGPPVEPPRAAVFGVITGPLKLPVPGALVALRGEIDAEQAEELRALGYSGVLTGPFEHVTVADGDGRYELDGLLPVPCRLYPESDRFLRCYPPRARLEAGTRSERNFELCRRARLWGRVADADGRAVPGAEVFVRLENFPTCPGREQVRDADGRAEYTVFAVDEQGAFDTGFCLVDVHKDLPLLLRANAPGYGTETVSVKRADLDDGEAELRLVLSPEQRAVVHVRDPAGNPLEGARVTGIATVRAGRRDLAPAVAGPDGRVFLAALSATRHYKLKVRAEGYKGKPLFLPAERPQDFELDVVLESIRDRPAVRGRVVFDEAIPESARQLESVEVALERARDLARGKFLRVNDQTVGGGDDLDYVFHPEEPGWYVLALDHTEPRTEPFFYDGRTELEVDLRIPKEAPYVAGRVLDRVTGRPVAGVLVSGFISLEGGSWGRSLRLNGFGFPQDWERHRTTSSGADGTFFLRLPRRDRWNWTFQDITLRAGSSEEGWSEEIVLPFDEELRAEEVVLEVERPGHLEGTIFGASGEPLAGETVAAYRDGRTVLHTSSAADGTYRIGGMPPGTFWMVLLGPGTGGAPSYGEGCWDDLPPPSQLFPRAVEVGAGETARLDLDAESDSLGRLVVTLPEALSTVTVECSAIVDGKLRGRCGTFYREGQEFEVRGRFLFPHLPPGEYVVWSDSDDVGEAVRRCETRVRLDRGTTTELTMPAPVCSLVVPLELPEGLAASDVAVFAVQAYDGESALSSHGWTPWAFSARPLDGAIEVTGLPPKPIRCGLLAPGCPEAWSEPVNLSLAPRASSATARLAAGQPIRVRLVTATADSPPKEPSFRVYRREPEFRRVTFTATRQGDDLWSLSAFVPGTYEVRVSDMEYGSAEGTVTVGADSAAEITLEREP